MTERSTKLGWKTVASIPSGIWALGFVSMFMDISSEMIHALLPVYLLTVLGTSTATIGVIEGIAEATASLTKIFSGAMSDWFGKRKLLAAAGYGLAAFTKPVFPLASSVEWLIAARFIDRVGKGIRDAPRDALVADLAPEHLRGASFGLRQAMDTVGAFLGPLIAISLMLLTANNFTFVFWAAVIPAFVSLAVIIFAVADPVRPRDLREVKFPLHRSEISRLPSAYWFVTAVAAMFTLARFSEAFLVLKAQATGLPVALIPAVLVLMNVVYALASLPAGIIADRPGGRGRVLILGLLLLIGADFVLVFGPGLATTALGVALWGLHMGLTQGLLAAMIADTAPQELRGTAYGMFNLITGVALLLASIIAGELWDRFGPSTTFLCGAAFAAAALAGWSMVRNFARPAPASDA